MDRGHAEHLLDALYGMDLQTPDWTPFFACLSEAFGSHVITLQAQDTMLRMEHLAVATGLSESLQTRFSELLHENPWFLRGTAQLLSEGVADDRGLATEAELRATRFCAELFEPARIGHGMALCLHRKGTADMAVLTINRDWHPGYYNESELELAHSLLPHLRNVYALQQSFSWMEGTSRSFRSALDQITDGVLLLDASGHLLFCNIAAQQMEAGRLFARKLDGRLHMPWPPEEHALSQALQKVGVSNAAAPIVQPLHNRDGKLTGMLKFCSAGMVAGTQWSEFQVRVIVFIKVIVPATFSTTSNLETQWGFTHAESQLASWLVEGLSLDEAADRIGVSKNTVRTQLRALFDKTETRRQADLMRVLLQLSHV
jgi:DNA-binding CsgD family transcriptional regulator/PAS domain-containing protein